MAKKKTKPESKYVDTYTLGIVPKPIPNFQIVSTNPVVHSVNNAFRDNSSAIPIVSVHALIWSDDGLYAVGAFGEGTIHTLYEGEKMFVGIVKTYHTTERSGVCFSIEEARNWIICKYVGFVTNQLTFNIG